jgi:ubiquitin-conjugating enzyme E2 variant
VTFISKVNLPCVDQRNGKVSQLLPRDAQRNEGIDSWLQVDLSKLPSISTWKRDFTMETILIEIRRYMAAPANKKLPQPPEGTDF